MRLGVDINTSFSSGKKSPKQALLILPVAVVLISIFSWFWYQSNLSAPSQVGVQKVFVVQVGESVASIINKLQKEGLIKNSLAFRLYLRLNGQDGNIQTGDFKLKTNQSAKEIAQELTSGVVDVWVTLLEGWRNEEMAGELHKKLGIDKETFINEAKEGYMFPDTYLINKEATAAAVISILKNNFNKRLKENDLTGDSGTKKLTFEEKIILASIIEREARDGLEERAMIAGILLNRLNVGMALQADATIQYDLGKDGNWWPKLTQEDYKKDLPFSTYTKPGLPPGPICNPGIQSIKASFNPTKTDNLYYIHGKDGVPHYAKTLDEHNQNVAKYL